MLVHTNTYEGMPPRLYRHPSEIQADIAEVRASASEIENMLSVRELILSLAAASEKEPDEWIPEFKAALAEAEEALEHLHILKNTLNSLGEELCEVRCILKR